MTVPAPAGTASGEAPAAARGERTALCALVDDAGARDVARRRLARLAALAVPHSCPLRLIHECAEGFQLTYDVPTALATWADLTRQRVPTLAETVGVGLAACRALQPLHAAGLAHGAVTPDRLLIARDGTVELTDAGAASAAEEDQRAAAANDVRALAGLLAESLPDGGVTSGLALLLVRAADPDDALLPTVVELASALERQCSPEPVRLDAPEAVPAIPDPPGEPSPRSRAGEPSGPSTLRDQRSAQARRQRGRHHAAAADEHHRPRRTGRAGGALATARGRVRPLLLAGALVVGLVLVARGASGLLRTPPAAGEKSSVRAVGTFAAGRGSTAATAPSAPVPDWSALVHRLDVRRAAAMAAGSAALLAGTVDPEGPAFARDLATLRARQAAGVRLDGGALSVRSIRLDSAGPAQVTLEVTDERAAYRLLDSEGAVVVSAPARTAATWRVVLTEDAGGWRIYDATRVG